LTLKANNYFNKTTKSIGITEPAKGSNGLPDKSLVVYDRKRLRPGHWVGLVLCFFQRWLGDKDHPACKNQFTPKGSLLEQVEDKNQTEHIKPGSPGKQPLKLEGY